jgi:hypothetical protein
MLAQRGGKFLRSVCNQDFLHIHILASFVSKLASKKYHTMTNFSTEIDPFSFDIPRHGCKTAQERKCSLPLLIGWIYQGFSWPLP